MKISYNWLKWYIPEIPEADKLADVFTYHLCEVESVEKLTDGDSIFDLNILPNRAHDLLSHLGIARELSGQLGIKFNDPVPMYKVPISTQTNLGIEIKTPFCRRYMGAIVRGVKVGPSPEWVVKHLESIGQRSINNIVDATNLVMFNCGQPTHAFDLDKLTGEKIIIRLGEGKESIDLLKTTTSITQNGIDIPADLGRKIVGLESIPLICDEAKPLAIAGVKGGRDSCVEEKTKNILLEVANFDPTAIRIISRKNNLITDASKRFENNLSPEHCVYAMRELRGLFMEMFPEATYEEIVDIYPEPQVSRVVTFSTEEVNKKLGTDISSDEIEAIMTRYAYTFDRNDDTFKFSVPALRLDITGSHDMAEEIGRIMGYDRVVPTIPKIAFSPKQNEIYSRMRAAREKLLADGYSEVMTYTFTKKGAVEVARGAKGKEFLRTNLSDGLKESYELNRLNAPLLGNDETKIFEIGTVFISTDKEEMHVAYADKKGVVELTLEEFTRDLALDAAPSEHAPSSNKFAPWSSYPFISRDIAVWVPAGTPEIELVSLCKEKGTELLARAPRIFDRFTKDDKTSLAIRLVFQSPERTLTDTDVASVMETIDAAIAEKKWTVR